MKVVLVFKPISDEMVCREVYWEADGTIKGFPDRNPAWKTLDDVVASKDTSMSAVVTQDLPKGYAPLGKTQEVIASESKSAD